MIDRLVTAKFVVDGLTTQNKKRIICTNKTFKNKFKQGLDGLF